MIDTNEALKNDSHAPLSGVSYSLESLTKRQKDIAKGLIETKGHLRFDAWSNKVTVYPTYDQTTAKTAMKVVECLGLKHFPGYNVYPQMPVGSYAYCFPDYS